MNCTIINMQKIRITFRKQYFAYGVGKLFACQLKVPRFDSPSQLVFFFIVKIRHLIYYLILFTYLYRKMCQIGYAIFFFFICRSEQKITLLPYTNYQTDRLWSVSSHSRVIFTELNISTNFLSVYGRLLNKQNNSVTTNIICYIISIIDVVVSI